MGIVKPKLGDFGLVRTPDFGGRVIRIGTDSWMNHAFIYVGDGKIIEARPGGADYNEVQSYAKQNFHLSWSTDLIPLTQYQREAIAKEAIAQRGIKYNWADIGALSLSSLGFGTPPWAAKIIENDHRLICSQLVDKVYRKCDVHLFNDGRLTGSVTPGDLWNLLLAAGW
jgi:hypothetical protein